MVLRITIDVQTDNIQGVKECLAMELERYGDVRVMDVSPSGHPGRKPDTIGDRIRRARMAECLTQRDLAEVLFVSESLVSRWETNQRIPDDASLQRIADATQVKVEWLRCEKGVLRT